MTIRGSLRYVMPVAVLGLSVIGYKFLKSSKPPSDSYRNSIAKSSLIPVSQDPATPSDQMEKRELSLDQIAGLTKEQVAGLLNRMNATERAEMGRRLTLSPPNGSNERKISLFFSAWAQKESGAAFQMALNFRNKALLGTALMAVFEGADPKDSRELVTNLKNMRTGTVNAELAQALLNTGLSKWALVDGAGAAEFLNNYGEDASPFIWQTVGENWATADPVAALKWAEAHTDSRIKDGIMMSWTKTDPAAVAEYTLAHFDGGFESQRYTSLVANRLAGNDPRAALDYIQKLPEGPAKQQAQLLAAIRWAHLDPAAAAAWVSSLPLADQGAATGVAGMWATQDPQAAGNWINSLQGQVRDSAVNAYASSLAARDPATAIGWTQTIDDPQIRTTAMERLIGDWRKRDPAAATAWINNSQLSAADKARLLVPPHS